MPASVSQSSISRWAERDPGTRRALSKLAQLPRVKHGAEVPKPLIPGDKDSYHEACAKVGYPGHLAPEIAKAPVVDMVLGPFRCVQHSVNPDRVAQYLHKPDLVPKGARGEHGGPIDLPIIVKAGGHVWCHDGTHRLSAAVLHGDKSIKVRYCDLDAAEPD